jgi:asparagine N-glycosylation enzyme membrane subunit Stt3
MHNSFAQENSSNLTNNTCHNKECPSETIQMNYLALLLLILCISVVFGNVLVILSVAKERSLQNITNYFIVSLAVADLCVAGVVMPFYTYTLVSQVSNGGHKQ